MNPLLEHRASFMRSRTLRGLAVCRRLKVAFSLLLSLATLGSDSIRLHAADKVVGKLMLSDGRLLQIEGITWGTVHRIGTPTEIQDRLGSLLPTGSRGALRPKDAASEIILKEPAMVVWVNAVNPATGTNVDCQGLRVELLDEHGDVFREETHNWFGGSAFWRVGHIFSVFPRTEKNLTLRVTPWRGGVSATTQITNPHPVKRASWHYDPLPQRKADGDMELSLMKLVLSTNGSPKKYWESPVAFWKPVWRLQHQGSVPTGWDSVDWVAEDSTGNRGHYLGTNQPGLRFTATVYPRSTNEQAAKLVATLPAVDLAKLGAGVSWNSTHRSGKIEVAAMGLMPAGTHTFTGGEFVSNAGLGFGSVIGGAPSGWTGQSEWKNPLKKVESHGHYTPNPVVYLRFDDRGGAERIAVRLRDGQGRLWPTEPEPQGVRDQVHPFLVKLPAGVTNVIPEIVILKPRRAEFTVETPNNSVKE